MIQIQSKAYSGSSPSIWELLYVEGVVTVAARQQEATRLLSYGTAGAAAAMCLFYKKMHTYIANIEKQKSIDRSNVDEKNRGRDHGPLVKTYKHPPYPHNLRDRG